jgi:pimeloyl-ACP methyl ester carboxylesterase
MSRRHSTAATAVIVRKPMTTPQPSRLRRVTLAVVLPAVAAGALAACGDPAPSAAPAPAPPAGTPASSAPSAEARTVTRDGRRLAFHVTPGKLPAIVLDAGGGEDSSYWKDLVPQLSKATGSQVITYDRAGLGGSDEVKGPWDVHSAVADLAAGLKQLGVTRDVVLVAHSQAGEVATYFVRDNPGVVSGAVLVDANLPQFFTDAQIDRIVAVNTPQIEELKKQPSTKANRQLIATAANFGPAHREFHRASWPDSVPATVIVSEKTPFDGSPPDARHWRDAAAEFVKAGPERTLITAAGTSHDVAHDDPALVGKAIGEMAGTRG